MPKLANDAVPILKRYLTGGDGQIHIREAGPRGVQPVACLHATAYSSRTFVPLLKLLGKDRHAIAIDTPGYGDSDAPASLLDIAGYSASIAEALASEHRSIDLVGYHTGVSIAVEMAIRSPQLVRRLVLVGIPYFRALDFGHWRGKLAGQHHLTADLAQFDERWDFLVTRRPPGVSLETGFRNFVDELKAWPNGALAHAALFDHDLDARLPLIEQPVLVLNPAGHLAMPSRTAARLIPDVDVVEMPEHSGAVLETAAKPISARIAAFLDGALVAA